MFAFPRWFVALLCCALLGGSSLASRMLPQDAYVWQRRWTPAVAGAVQESADLVRAWRVLAAEIDPHGVVHRVEIDWPTLASSHRSAILVIRIDGRVARPDAAEMLDQVDTALRDGRSVAVPIAGIEIDHDCATARLPDYARLLTVLRARLDPAVPLSITALPTWTPSPDLPGVLAEVGEVVLQVHAVQNPHAGLFDRVVARSWIDDFAHRTRIPFRVALPTYGTRVIWDADGRMLTAESERPLLLGGAPSTELVVSPADVAALLRDLQRDPPRRLAGVVWFRLPTRDDRRAWSLATWRAVAQGLTPNATVTAVAEPVDIQGLRQIALENTGDFDALLPRAVVLSAHCTVADGVNGYVLADDPAGLSLHRQRAGLLHEHSRLMIGWMRCGSAVEDPHVEP